MMRALCRAVLPALVVLASAAASAQPADLPIPAAGTDPLPPGLRILHKADLAVYADAQGHVLYGMDMRTLLRAGPDPAQYCTGDCAAVWQPVLAPAGSVPNIGFPRKYGQNVTLAGHAPGAAATAAKPQDWTIIAGPQGPQWVYKSWHMVFIRRGDRPGSTAFDGAEDHTWNTLKYIPPMPKIVAPGNVQAVLVGSGYALADKDGHLLFTGSCGKSCAGWQPLGAGMASAPLGEWTVSTAGDAPQWLWRGKPVFVSQEDDLKQVPASGRAIKL